jgi:hypothetical protein
VVGAESTLDYEAMILEKPVINISLGSDFSLPFVDEGAAIGVRSVCDISYAIDRCLTNEDVRNRLKENMKKLVAEHCYVIDGKAAERSADIIRRML